MTHSTRLRAPGKLLAAAALPALVVCCSSEPKLQNESPRSDAGLSWYDSSDPGSSDWDYAPGAVDSGAVDSRPADASSVADDSSVSRDSVPPPADQGSSDIGAADVGDQPTGPITVESITAYGRYWNFEVERDYRPWPSNGSDLTSVARFFYGPCARQSATTCRFDTRTLVIIDNHLIESITAYGKYWNFDSDDAYRPWPSNGSDLTSVARYADGPCAGRAAGTCRFDTRTFTTIDGHRIESITAYGKYWNFDADDAFKPWPSNGSDLTSVARYADGPCAGRAAGDCRFDTRTFVTVNGHRIESMTAYGRYWNFDADDAFTPWSGNGSTLVGVGRYGDPCQSANGGACTFDTRTFMPPR